MIGQIVTNHCIVGWAGVDTSTVEVQTERFGKMQEISSAGYHLLLT